MTKGEVKQNIVVILLYPSGMLVCLTGVRALRINDSFYFDHNVVKLVFSFRNVTINYIGLRGMINPS